MLRHMRSVGWFALFAVTSLAASQGHAHFILLKPDSWLNEDQSAFGGGAPQKAGPCGPGGGDDIQPVPTNGKVTEVHVGDTVHVQWQVTVPHAGYFRIALAENRTDLKDPPLDDAVQCTFNLASVPKGAHDNVLMDGIDANATMQDVKLPDKACDKCTLQVIQVMQNHGPPNCIYYHCADLKILAAGASTGTGGTGAAGSGAAGGGSGASGASGASGGASGVGAGAAGRGAPVTGTGGMVGTAINNTAGQGGTSAGTPASMGPAVGAPVGSGVAGTGITGSPTPTAKKSGCSVADGGPAGSMGLLLFTLLALSRRRRAA